VSVDLVVVRLHGNRLWVLARRDAMAAPSLPSIALGEGESPSVVARRLALSCTGQTPRLLEQVGAFTSTRHPLGAALTVAYVALVPHAQGPHALGSDALETPADGWVPAASPTSVAAAHRPMIKAALRWLGAAVSHTPVAFALLPAAFTLSELQGSYEHLLGRRLHKASFRRALLGAALVEATEEWRSEGRGRPAQLYRYSPMTPGGEQRPLRFDFSHG
jgi:8-oxo-dGTP diphosphatase